MEISRGKLASLVGVSERSVTELAKQGVVKRAARGKYQMEVSIKNYCNHLRQTAAGRGGKDQVETLAEERARLAREQADGHALKNAQLRDELLPRVDVEAMWSRILGEVRSGMLAVPSRIQQRILSLTVSDVSAIDSEIREALRALGDGTAAE